MAKYEGQTEPVSFTMISAASREDATDLYGLTKDGKVYRYGAQEQVWLPLEMVKPEEEQPPLKAIGFGQRKPSE